MKKIVVFTIVIFAFFFQKQVAGQQYPFYNLYSNNKFLYNPAHTGDKELFTAFMHSRRQWLGFDGAPKTLSVGFHAPVNEDVGLGLNIRSQTEGIFERLGANVSYSYTLSINNFHSLTFGVSGGFLNMKINQSKARVTSLDDPGLYDDYYDKTRFDASAALVYRWKNLELDIAAPQLFTMSERIIGMFTYRFEVANKKVHIMPIAMYQLLPQSPDQYDAGMQLAWKQRIWLEGLYRSNENLVFSCGFNFNSIGFGYAYEVNSNELMDISDGSHEVVVHFFFGKKGQEEEKEMEEEVHELEKDAKE